MKKECEIVKDLLPSYVENLVSGETKKYVECHITNCSECRRISEDMKENNIIESKQNLKEEEVEIKHIKKYKRKMTILKICIISFIGIIVFVVSVFGVKYIPKYSIILKAYNKIQKVSSSDNFKLTMNQYYILYDTQERYEFTDSYYYKNGKYKEESCSNALEIKKTYYGDVNSTTETFIYESKGEKTVNEIEIYEKKNKESFFGVFCDIKNHSQNILSLFGVNIRNDNYNERECYVLRYGNNNTSYREIWIDKETMQQVREIQEIMNKSYFERTFVLESDNVTDEDVTLSK